MQKACCAWKLHLCYARTREIALMRMRGNYQNCMQTELTFWAFNSFFDFCIVLLMSFTGRVEFSWFLFSLKCWSHITILIHVGQRCNSIFRSILFSNCIIYSYLCLSFWLTMPGCQLPTQPCSLSFLILTRG